MFTFNYKVIIIMHDIHCIHYNVTLPNYKLCFKYRRTKAPTFYITFIQPQASSLCVATILMVTPHQSQVSFICRQISLGYYFMVIFHSLAYCCPILILNEVGQGPAVSVDHVMCRLGLHFVSKGITYVMKCNHYCYCIIVFPPIDMV